MCVCVLYYDLLVLITTGEQRTVDDGLARLAAAAKGYDLTTSLPQDHKKDDGPQSTTGTVIFSSAIERVYILRFLLHAPSDTLFL